jgi:coenzyme PQQ biosynthesis protein PqqD
MTDCRPRLADKARLRFDRHANRHMLLYPEKGLALSATATEIVKLCDGERTVSEIVVELRKTYDSAPAGVLEKEVADFLGALRDRGLLVENP